MSNYLELEKHELINYVMDCCKNHSSFRIFANLLNQQDDIIIHIHGYTPFSFFPHSYKCHFLFILVADSSTNFQEFRGIEIKNLEELEENIAKLTNSLTGSFAILEERN